MRPSLNGVGIWLMEEDVFVLITKPENDIKRQSFVTGGKRQRWLQIATTYHGIFIWFAKDGSETAPDHQTVDKM